MGNDGYTHVADNVADKNISNMPMNVADMLGMLLIFWNVADRLKMLPIHIKCC